MSVLVLRQSTWDHILHREKETDTEQKPLQSLSSFSTASRILSTQDREKYCKRLQSHVKRMCYHIHVSNTHLDMYRYIEDIVTPTYRFVHSLEMTCGHSLYFLSRQGFKVGYTAPREEPDFLARNLTSPPRAGSSRGAPLSLQGTVDCMLMPHLRPMMTHLITQLYVILQFRVTLD